jgi:hypothetical protein
MRLQFGKALQAAIQDFNHQLAQFNATLFGISHQGRSQGFGNLSS